MKYSPAQPCTLLLALMSCLASPFVHAQEKPLRTPIVTEPWQPASTVGPKVVYGTDDRIDVYAETNAQRRTWAASTCALVTSGRLQLRSDGTYLMSTAAFRPLGLTPCEGEPFATQPTAAFCTGWMAGDDIIVTAGHCYDSSDISGTRFVFGFDMIDASTPDTTFSADQVYTGVAVLGHALAGDDDYSVIRVDRRITAPGAVAFPIRRSGVVPVGTAIGVIGHPSGLPKKLAFGSATAVRSNTNTGYFVANLDTYGGNSGSPVINATTGVAEGILVRGESDYINDGGCGRTNTVSNTGGRGEDVSKTVRFMQFIPETSGNQGELVFDQERYACEDYARITLTDYDLAGTASVLLHVTTTQGDDEVVVLAPPTANASTFEGAIDLVESQFVPGDGMLQVHAGETIRVRYTDEAPGTGGQSAVQDSATIDCTPPSLSGVTVSAITGSQVQINLVGSESTTARILYGPTCGTLPLAASDTARVNHGVVLNNLSRGTTYQFQVELTDLAGNTERFDNAGACYSFTTVPTADYFTQAYPEGAAPLSLHTVLFTPAQGSNGYTACIGVINALPVDPTSGINLGLGDDANAKVTLGNGATVSLYDEVYDAFYVGSNGFITFGAGDDAYQAMLETHFNLPRIAVLFGDLSPTKRGSVRFLQQADRAVISWLDVPQFVTGTPLPTNTNTAQVELFFDGRIRLSYGAVTIGNAISGLSRGMGLPADFAPSSLTGYPSCFDAALDSDEDGLSDIEETATYHTNPFDDDTDSDGMTDGWEVRGNLDPLSNDASVDSDRDGLSNRQEFDRHTRPDRADSDRDGVSDGAEVTAGTDPTGVADFHSADVNHSKTLSLNELLRVVQLYNAGAYHCEGGTEDGYGLKAGTQACTRHQADYQSPAYSISVSELLRFIELYLATEYGRDLYSDDTFMPLP